MCTAYRVLAELETVTVRNTVTVSYSQSVTVRNNEQGRVSPDLIFCVNDSDLQMLLSNVGKLKGSGMRVCTDMPPSLNALRNELLSKARDLKAQQISKLTRVKQFVARRLL